ncbi:cation channel sperm-associated protein subunit zeta isoform X2 [Fukomys damarensis]|uniref:cation channel sperm-associated protein subunit zeta isoform X2 n=1 Tax=Fukomys damarensis TaxID=885580 RepID=UPI00053FFA11|nr:cation channel sperm-associated protein subunit zeta isoform X2 [Fukomys damarensis]
MLDGGSAPFPLMEREPPPPRPAGSAWVRWGRTMEEEPFKDPRSRNPQSWLPSLYVAHRRLQTTKAPARDKDRFKSEDLDQHTLLELEPPRSRSLGNHLVEVASESEIRKESLSSAWEHADFQLYLAEQQKKLPLPLRELMETEALEILTKALKSYRSKIGENHFLTKELQRRVEELQRRRRLLWTSQ